MRNAALILLSATPCIFALLGTYCNHKAVALLKNFKLLFDTCIFILKGSALEPQSLFSSLCNRNVFSSFCVQICENLKNGESFSQSWTETMTIVNAKVLNKSEQAELASFSDRFGFGSLEEQLLLCEHFSSFCSERLKQRKAYMEKNGKMYLSGSLLVGAFLFVLFV